MFFLKIAKVTVLTTVLTLFSVFANAKENGKQEFDWNPLMDAISIVESEGDSRAVSGKSCGVMQITPITVEQCNIILKQRGEKKRFTLNDRFSIKKSREMFVLIQSHFNPGNNVERAIRLWNGGSHYTIKGTQRYYNKVMKVYK